MGELIVMPAPQEMQDEEMAAVVADMKEMVSPDSAFLGWLDAPRERTAPYFPTYSAVSRAMQRTLRAWVAEWMAQNPEILQRPSRAYPILVYQCTHPFAGRPTNIFTYDIHETVTLNRAFRSAASKMSRLLKTLDTKSFSWFTREHYFAYRGKEVVKHVTRNPRSLYRMLHVETLLMDALLRFTIMDLPAAGMEKALFQLRRTFRTQLRRFSPELDLAPRTEELLTIVTQALLEKMDADAQDLPEAA